MVVQAAGKLLFYGYKYVVVAVQVVEELLLHSRWASVGASVRHCGEKAIEWLENCRSCNTSCILL